MARQRRTWVPGTGAHTICRFIDRRFYLVDELDRECLLDAISRAHERWDWQWLSYAAMSSHLHYGHVAGSVAPERFFRSAHTRLARQYHQHTGGETLGHVFASRPKIHSIAAAALPRLVAYHHRNPVEAGVVARASESTWTSHRAYLRLDPAPPWLNVERALDVLGFCDTAAGRRRFDEFVMEVDLAEPPTGARPKPVGQLSKRLTLEEAEWSRLIDVARRVGNLPVHTHLRSRRRGATARFLIAMIATRDLGQTCATVAARLDMNAGSVSNMISRMEYDARLPDLVAEVRRNLDIAAE